MQTQKTGGVRQKLLISFLFQTIYNQLMKKAMLSNKATLILYLILTSILPTTPKPTLLLMEEFQTSFNKAFCGGCNEERCIQTMRQISILTGIDISMDNIINNPLNITTISLQVKTIKNKKYTISGRQYSVQQTEYLLAMPVIPEPGKFMGVISYMHGTIFNKSQVPSNIGGEYLALIAFYCSKGYGMILPNYMGLGKDYRNIHPYVNFPIPNVQYLMYALDDAYPTLNKTYGIKIITVYAVGYSQGGAYAIWTGLCQQEQFQCNLLKPLDSKKYYLAYMGGLEGAFDVQGVVIPFLREEVSKDNNKFSIETTKLTTLLKPGLTAMAAISFATYNSTPFPLQSQLNSSFFGMVCTGPISALCLVKQGVHLNLTAAFKEQSLDNIKFPQAIGFSAMSKQLNGIKYASQFQWETGSKLNRIDAFVKQTFFSAAFNATSKIASLTNKQFIYPKRIFIFTLQKDSVVSPKNSDNLFAANPQSQLKKFQNSLYNVCDDNLVVPVDHLRGQMIANIYFLKFLLTAGSDPQHHLTQNIENKEKP